MNMKKANPKFFKGLSFWVFLVIAALMLSNLMGSKNKAEKITYSEFRNKLESGHLKKVKVSEDEIAGYYINLNGDAVKFEAAAVEDPGLVNELQLKGVEFEGDASKGWFQMILFNFGPILLFIIIWLLIIQQMRSGGKQAMSFGKSKAKLHIKDKKNKVTFESVAGLEESKEELQEIIEYLRNPKKFTRLGGEIPKGVLLYGAPGTGKTLLAKAVAGEAEVPFFSTSGSEFVEMFVGVGASRIRDLFEKGRKNSPCLLFIDELDAVGRSRFSGLGGGHDEREQTLNQMLVELDGFDSREGVILLGATNRPDVLDPALLRKGRFDRHIGVPSPDINERKEIIQLHAKKVKAEGVDFDVLARRTPGFVGSDLANMVNEGALLAARENAKKVTMRHMEEAIDRVIAGPEKKSRVISEDEKNKIAYHESGHTLVALCLPNADPVHKVSILPRGPALGYTLQLPMEDRYLTSEDEILDKMTVLLGGRSAEEVIFNMRTTGAHDDLRRATEIAYKIVTEFGMSKELGPLVFQKERDKIFLGKDLAHGREYSEETARLIDKGAMEVISKCYERAKSILEKHRDKLEKLAQELIKREIIQGDEINKIVGIKVKKPAKPADKKETAKKKKSTRKKKEEKPGEDG
ncbi:ATP-dependent zinc metalloprotease FtsH [Elusimicrobiota bacterium]